MRSINEQRLQTPFYGSPQMAVELKINRKHTQRPHNKSAAAQQGVRWSSVLVCAT
jgi:hypothetical protein